MEKKCKHCTIMIPKEASICPYCRKRQGWPLFSKIVAGVFISGLLVYLYHDFSLYILGGGEERQDNSSSINSGRQPSVLQQREDGLSKKAPEIQRDKEIPVPIRAAPDLIEEYEANEVKADILYKGRQIVIIGIVEEISKDWANSPYVVLGPRRVFSGVQCCFSRQDEPMLAALNKGMAIGVQGECRGKLLMNITVNNCIRLSKEQIKALLPPPATSSFMPPSSNFSPPSSDAGAGKNNEP